jgi:hypothetical protein
MPVCTFCKSEFAAVARAVPALGDTFDLYDEDSSDWCDECWHQKVLIGYNISLLRDNEDWEHDLSRCHFCNAKFVHFPRPIPVLGDFESVWDYDPPYSCDKCWHGLVRSGYDDWKE